MNDLRDKGVAMVYISHKMDEIKRIADDITVMRDGTYVGTWPAAEMTTDQIITNPWLLPAPQMATSNIGNVIFAMQTMIFPSRV